MLCLMYLMLPYIGKINKACGLRTIRLFLVLLMKYKLNNSEKPLREFWGKHADLEQYSKTWHETAKNSNWNFPNQV